MLLRRAGCKGYVFPPGNGWVTFVVEGGDFEPDERIVSTAIHPLLHYVSAEDHGWKFTFFYQSQVVSGNQCEWDDELRSDDSKYSGAAILRYVPTARMADFEPQLHPGNFEELPFCLFFSTPLGF